MNETGETLWSIIKSIMLPQLVMLGTWGMDMFVYSADTYPTTFIKFFWAISILVSIVFGYFHENINENEAKHQILGVAVATTVLFILFGLAHSYVYNHPPI